MDLLADTDADLLGRWLSGRDERAFADLVERHRALVYAVCRRRLGDPAGADDAAQAVFIILSRKASELPAALGDGSLAPWLHTVAHHVCANALRERARRQARERDAGAAIESTPDADGWHDARLHVDAALAALPDRYRRPLVLRYLSGLGGAQLAGALGISPEATRKRLERGLDLLRRRLAAHGAPVASSALVAGLAADAAAAPLHIPAPNPHAIHLADLGIPAMSAAAIAVPIVTLLAASLTVGAVLLAGADGAAPPVPAAAPPAVAVPPAWQLRPGQVLLYDSVLEWTMTTDAPAGAKEMLAGVIPSRVVEATLYRAQVESVVDGRAVVAIEPLRTWRCLPDRSAPFELERRGADGTVVRETWEGGHLSGTPGLGAHAIALTAAGVAMDRGGITNSTDVGPAVSAIGLPDLLVPLGLGDTGPELGFPSGVSAGATEAKERDPSRWLVRWARIDQRMDDILRADVAPLGRPITISVSVDATGSGEAAVHWDAVTHAAAAVASTWSFDVTVRLNQVGGGLALAIPGRMAFTRHATLLTADAAADTGLVEALAVLEKSGGERWRRVAGDAKAPTEQRGVALALLHDLAQGERLDQRWFSGLAAPGDDVRDF